MAAATPPVMLHPRCNDTVNVASLSRFWVCLQPREGRLQLYLTICPISKRGSSRQQRPAGKLQPPWLQPPPLQGLTARDLTCPTSSYRYPGPGPQPLKNQHQQQLRGYGTSPRPAATAWWAAPSLKQGTRSSTCTQPAGSTRHVHECGPPLQPICL